MIPLYRGLPIFGSSCCVVTIDRRREKDLNGTFGRDGLEVLDGGGRGRTTVIRGTLAGAGPAGLAAAEQLVRSCNDGLSGDLIDPRGVTWPNVQLLSFTPQGRIRQSAGGLLIRAFAASLLHLS